MLINGSFEDPIVPPSNPYGHLVFDVRGMPGWRITRGSVDVVSARLWQQAPEQGGQSLDLVGTPGAATIQQTLATEPGQYYVFSGWLAHNPSNPVAPEGRVNVLLNGQSFTQLIHADASATTEEMHWESFAYRFRAATATTTLALSDISRGAGYTGAVLDGLAVSAAPTTVAPTETQMFISAINDAPTRVSEMTVSVGDCVILSLRVRFGAGQLIDVTHDSDTSFYTDATLGTFISKETWCATPTATKKTIRLFGRFFDAVTQRVVTTQVMVHLK